MTAEDRPAPSRRRVLAAVAGAASAAGLAASCTSGSGLRPSARPLADAVLDAFRTHRLVGLGETHDLQNHGDALALLLSDPRLPGVVDDIVVEFGNSLYQDTIDAFIAGQPVNDAALRPVWRDTTGSPLATGDSPIYEQFYRTVRAVNWAQPPGKKVRVLLGDPPIDWATISSREQFLAFFQHRDEHFVSVVKQQVLARGRRALLCKGANAFFRPMAIEQQTGLRVCSIVDLTFPPGDPGGLATRLARYPRYSVIPAAGTWLGSFDAELALIGPAPGGPPIKPSPGPGRPGTKGTPTYTTDLGNNPFCGKKTADFIDAGLYLGQPGELTASWANPAIYLDPVYWAELQRRNTLGIPVDLDWYRRDHPARLHLHNLQWWQSHECRTTPQTGH